jgi:hypothetical protein
MKPDNDTMIYNLSALMTSRKAFTLLLVLSTTLTYAQNARIDWKLHNVGKIRQVVTNMGTLNKARSNYPGLLQCEFPPGSEEEHIYQYGIMVGGITPTGDTLVSVTQDHFGPNEFYPTAQAWDGIWTAKSGDTLQIPYWPNYVGLSDQDFICRYSDYNILNIDNHTPLYLDVIQASYAWSSPPVDEFIIYTYKIIPKKIPIKNAWVGYWLHGSVGTVNCGDNFIDEHALYFDEYKMGVDEDDRLGCDGLSISPIGFSVLNQNSSSLRWTFKYYEHEELKRRDPDVYAEICSGIIMPDRVDPPSRAHIYVAFGPFDLKVGDTLKVEIAEVLGYGLKGLKKNAEYVKFLKGKGFKVPSAPPKPIVRATTASRQVKLDWRPLSADANPELYTDPNRADTIKFPFEGYRLYRSTKGVDGPWTLLAEYDIVDNLRSNTGLEYSYTDNGVLNNIEYYYALTAFSKPDEVLGFPSQETSLTSSALTITPGIAPPSTVGQVAVVPNPYRGDIAYNSYSPPWEKPPKGRVWMEQDRRIQFINLPEECEIRIYSLAGDLVNTIYHNSPTRGFADWNLTSSVGQAVASGIYLFSAEDKKNGQVQVGKFVILK